MAIQSDLQAILNKSSGTYFLYYDRSQVPDVVSASGLRILVGQSKHGLVNTLTYHDTYNQFKKVYGDVDEALMRKGSYFHLSAYIMMQTGLPIAAINLRSFDDTLDKSDVVSISTVSYTHEDNKKVAKPYKSLFNTQGFWKPQPKSLSDNSDMTRLLTIANSSSTAKSIFIRKSRSKNLSKQTLSSYYSDRLDKKMPSYLLGSDFVGDTFVEVFVFDNAFPSASGNSSYGHLFNGTNNVLKDVTTTLGETVDGLSQLADIREARFMKRYEGSLIPTLLDESKRSLSILDMINRDVDATGLMADMNYDILDAVADWEPTLDPAGNFVYAGGVSKKPLPIDLVGHKKMEYNDIMSYKNIGAGGTATQAVKVSYSSMPKTFANADRIPVGQDAYIASTLTTTAANNTVTSRNNVLLAHDLWFTNKIGDKYVALDSNLANVIAIKHVGTVKLPVDLATMKLPIYEDGGHTLAFTKTNNIFVYPAGHANAGEPVAQDADGKPLDAVGGAPIAIDVSAIDAADLEAIVALHGTDVNYFELTLDRDIFEPATESNADIALLTASNAIVTTSGKKLWVHGKNATIAQRVLDINMLATEYAPITLKSYKARPAQFVDKTAARQNQILDVMIELIPAFKDIERVDFKYLVDSFKTYIEPNAKQQFGAVLKARTVGAAIVNPPSIKEFADSTNPYFRDTVSGKFNAKHVLSGGNLELPHTSTFKMGGVGNDKMYAYGPWSFFDYNGVEVLFPTAAGVSLNYALKNKSGSPTDAVFGQDTGTVNVVGMKSLEYDLSDDERVYFEKVGINPIVYKKNSGNVIVGNYTLFTKRNSALKFAHVNELITIIHDQMRPIAEFLLGKYNNDTNRLITKKRMDAVTTNMLASGALQYAENIVNTDNNTQEIISESMAIMDTVIVPSYSNTRVVHRLIINRTTDEITSKIL